MATSKVVCDAGPLIHLAELECLELVADFGEIWIPTAVHEEVVRICPTFPDQSGSFALRLVQVEVDRSPGFQTLVRTLSLDRGEVAALSLMSRHPGALFLTDDAAARMAAKSLGIRAYGTLGVLVRSIRRRSRSKRDVIELLRSIPKKSTLYIRSDLLAEIIAEVESASA